MSCYSGKWLFISRLLPVLFLWELAGIPTLFAQTPSNLRTRWLKTNTPAPLDSLTVYPESLNILSPADTSLHISFQNNILRFSGKVPDSVQVSYRVFNFNLNRKIFRRNPDSYRENYSLRTPSQVVPQRTTPRDELFSTRSLSKSGSISRGISFGNTQSVFVEGGLNLQLEGKLSEDVSVLAAITDQNVPYQPEGNTQTLQQFDRVFVQFANRRNRLSVGDIVLRNPVWNPDNQRVSHFLRYYKNVQGGLAEATYSPFAGQQAQTSLGGAVAKGRFASIFVQQIEGVQGPYRLRGPENERFIIILANSEKVFIDGRQLERGFNRDYVIDYNLAEITFNANVLITQFTRIRVDFEFSERNYSRTIVTAQHQQQVGKWYFFGNYYSEKDNPRNPLTVSLTEQDRQFLAGIGDSTDKAVVQSITPVEFTQNQILYRKVDTTINGQIFTAYVYSSDPAQAKFQLGFSETGQNKGNYVLKNVLANGRVYEWKAPVNGILQGNYEPVRRIPTPAKRQMVTLGTEYQLSKSESVVLEGAFSDRDVNLFSSLNDSKNRAGAFRAGYTNKGRKIKLFPDFDWTGSVDFEADQPNFSAIDRFRDIEFDRDWSFRQDTSRSNSDYIFNFSLGVQPAKITVRDTLTPQPARFSTDKILYRFSNRQRGEEINGWQQKLDFSKNCRKFQVLGSAFWLRTSQRTTFSEWQRLSADVSYPLTRFKAGYIFSFDNNRISPLSRRDSVIQTAMNFSSHTAYLQNPDTSATKFRLEYAWREDNLPQGGTLQRNTLSQTVSGSLGLKIYKTQTVNLLTTYRNLQYVRQLPGFQDEETILGRLDWNGNFWKENIRSELTYNLASGRELRREFVFLPVPTGQGTHTWRDDNKDGIQQLNEFYEAINPDERNFVKFFTPTDQYIRAFTQNFVYRLNAGFPLAWREAGSWKGFLQKFSTVFSWTLLRKITEEDIFKRFVPFASISDSALLSQQNTLRAVLFFNRTNPAYGLDLNFSRAGQKQLLTNGFETRQNQEIRLTSRVNLRKSFNLRTTLGQLQRQNLSDFFSNRNYRIRGYLAGPELTWQPSANFRLSGSYQFQDKKNTLQRPDNQESEQSVTHQFSTEMRWNALAKRTVSATVKYLQIDFRNGTPDSPVAYELLEALRPGGNWTWTLNWQQKLANGLQLNLTYEGRKSENQRIIQLGRVQVAALF
jgi:hypothetical protein